MLKAIETVYNGYRFRSRLEARWAVFFDAMGIEYQYELEGFDLGDGGYYLPDFWLPKWNSWVEVKPVLPTPEQAIKLTHFCLNTDQSNTHTCFICGQPGLPEVIASNDELLQVKNGYVILNLNVMFRDGQEKRWPNKLDAGKELEAAFQVSLFAKTQGGTELNVWPLYISEITDRESIEFFCEYHKLPPTELTEKVGPYRLYLCPLYPSGIHTRLYFGDGIVYETPDLLEAYTVARQARFGT